MNTEVELEDVSNSKKDGENDACTASTIDNPGGGSGDAIVDSNSNSDNPIKEQQPVLIDNTKITEALPPEKKVINIEVHQIESTKADDEYPVIDSGVLDEELLLNSDDEINEVDKKEIDDAVRNIEGTTNLDESDEKATKITIPTSEDDPDSSFELIFDTEEKPKDDPGSHLELVYDSKQMPTEASPADDNLKIIDQELGNIDATEIKAVETPQSEPNEQSKEHETNKLSEQKPEESKSFINSNNYVESGSNDNQTEKSGTQNTKNIEQNKEIAGKTNVDTVAHEVRRSVSLDWEDDDQQMQTDQSLSDDALKQLDAELGISDNLNDMLTIPVIEPVEDSEEIIPSSDSKVDIPIMNSKEISLNSQDTEMVERNLENRAKNIPDDNGICNEKIKNNVSDSIHDDSDALKRPDISLGHADIKAETVDNTSLMDVDIAEIDSNQEMAIGTKIDKNAMEVNETLKMSLETPMENTEKCEDNIASGEKCEKSIEATAKLSEKTESLTGFNETITEDLTKDVQSTRKLTSSDNNTIGIKTDHKIKRPDVMLDIPTQELIDCDDEESSENLKSNDNECDRYSLTSKTVTEIVNHLAASKSPEKTDTLKEHQDTAEDQKEETGKEDEELQPTEEEKSTKNAGSSKNIEYKLASNESQKTVIEPDDKKASDEKQEQTSIPTEIDVQPSTSKPEDVKVSDTTKTTPEEPNKTSEVIKTDDSEEAEDTDTLGLLAESSRVCDDDEEQEDIDGDAEYDDDVDPDDESSNPMTTAEHSEDSNTPETEPQETQASPDEERNFIKVSAGKDIEAIGETDKADDTIVDMVPGNEDDATSLVSDSNDANAEAMDTTDITIEENEPIVAKTTENETEDKEEDPNSLTVTEKLEEILNKSVNLDKSSKTRRRSILLELLSKIDNEDEALEAKIAKPSKVKKLEITPTKQVFYVDLDCDAEEDAKKDTKEVEEEASCDVTKVTDDSKTPPKDEVDKAADSKNEEGGKEVKDDDVEEIVNVAEILNLDSDEEVIAEEVSVVKNNSCINNNCTSDESVQYYKADKASISYYCGAKRRGALICQCCLEFVETRNKGLIAGIKDMRDLMDLEMEGPGQLLVEISDSDSEDGQDSPDDEPIGEDDAKLLEDQLGELINSSWIKYKMDERVKEAEDYLQKELEKIQKQSKELDEILKDCEKTTDKIRTDFYATFEPNKHELPALNIHDTPIASYFCMEKDDHFNDKIGPSRQYKRQATTAIDTPAKKQALPANKDAGVDQVKQDEDKDVSVVRLSAESAPLELPPPGEMTRAPLKLNMAVYAMKNSFGAWLPGKVIEITPQATGFTQCRIRFEHNMRNPCKVLPARCIAYTYPSDVRMTIGTRVVALFKNTDSSETKKESYYSGVVAEIPNPVNNYRYLVFFDDGYAQYVSHQHTRLVAESSAQVWEEVHPFSRDFVYNYLLKYPERPMVRMHKGQTISVELNGKWYETRVVRVDASLVQVLFIEEKRTEWIYRGSTRLRPLFVEFQAAKGGARTRLPRSTRNNAKTNMPYVEYTRSDEQANKNTTQEGPQQTEELRRLRAVAKKSTGPTPVTAPVSTDGATSRVVYYTPKHCIRPHKLTTHTCGPRCRRTDVLSLAELRTYNPLAKPLLSGWERQITRVKGHRAVMYRAPCGRRVRSMPELHRYLAALRSDLAVDLFDFNPLTHCLAEFVLTKYNVGKKDLSHGKENVPVACVNYYDTSLPEFCSYNTERTPTAGVPLNLDPEFLCGCDCTDDCADKAKCACWQMTLEGARTIGMEGPNIGYQYRRLLEPLPTGIYECNSRCKCKNTCLNRVAQHPLQLKLQVFKTMNRGWGIRALNDVPKGCFLCIYAGNLLTDATANLDGLNEGDEYLAELDYIEVVEAMKEGYEEDVVDPETKTDKKDSKQSDSGSESDAGESEEEERANKSDKEDDDFQPGSIGLGLTEFSKRLRQRDKKKTKDDSTEDKDGKTKEDNQDKDKDKDKKDGDCITISDDEEVREPARFTAQEGMGDKKFVSKYKSIRDYFGKDEACYIMDAKVQGNIGRYLNHSCSPNVFVQNVFVDTHDPRFPWVSFFALHHIKAGTELTWNYNYDVGSVPGKVLYCFCGAYNCRGRLL